MPTSIDTLQIEINAKAVKANDAIDRLVGKLNGLTTSLGKLNTSSLNGLANGVQKLGNAMQVMNNVKTADFTRLARNLSSMGNINTQGLNNTASSLSQITRAMNNIGAVSHNAVQLSEMAKNLSKFGGANVQRATVNIPLLANELRKLMMTLSSAPNVSRNIIDMTNALANLSAQGSRVGSASRGISNGLNRTYSSTVRASKGFRGLTSAIGMFYARYFLVMRAIKALGKAVTSTADYIEAFNYYTVSFGKIASKWDENWENYGDENARNYSNSFVTTMNDTFKKLSGVSYDPQTGLLSETGLKNLGLNLQEVTQFAAQLGSMMDAVGHSGEVTLATTNAFVRLAGDISSLYNIDYSEAAGKLRSVLQGQSRAGYGFGWDTTMASLQATADELNLSKAVSEMSQMEKQQLRILTILNQSRVAYGDQSNTINTLANQLRLLKNNIKEASMVLGQLFVPILSKLIPVINGTTIAIKRLMGNLASIFGIKIEDTGQGFTDMEDDAENLEDTYDDLAESIKAAKNQLLGFDEVNKLQEPTSVTGIDGDSIDLTDEILTATKKYEEIWQEAFDKMEANSNKWADRIEKSLSRIGEVFEDFTLGEYFKAGEDVSDLVIDINNFISKAIKNVDWQGIGNNVGLFLKGIKWSEVFMSLLGIIDAAFDGLWDAWYASFKESPVETALLTAIGVVNTSLVANALMSKLSTISSSATPLKLGVYLMVTVIGIQVAEEVGTKIGEAFLGSYDPWVHIKEEEAHADKLQGIVDKYENLNSQVERYIELSKNYENLTEEEKGYVYQMGQELQNAGIVTGINDITKAWEGTTDELKKAIEYQSILARMSTTDQRIADLEFQAEEAYNKYIEAHENFQNVPWYKKLAPVTYAREWSKVEDARKEYESILEVLTRAELDKKYLDKEVNKIINSDKKIIEGLSEEAQKEWADIMYGNVSLEGITSINNELDPFANIDINNEEALRQLDELIFKQEDTKNEIEGNSIKTNINNSNYINGMNYATTMFTDFSYLVNNSNLMPSINGVKAMQTIQDIANKYNTEKNTIENKKINPTVDTSTAKSQTSGLFKILNQQYGTFKTTVKVEEDKKSLAELTKNITEKISSIQLKMDIFNVGKEVMATFKSIIPGFATGGFPEDGLFFANHNELVGGFGNGKTAVANNEQITEGIEHASYRGMARALAEYQGNGGNVTVVLQGDADNLFRVVQNKANNYARQTGLSPFNI